MVFYRLFYITGTMMDLELHTVQIDRTTVNPSVSHDLDIMTNHQSLYMYND